MAGAAGRPLLSSISHHICLHHQQRWLSRKPVKPGKPPILPPSKMKLYRVPMAKWSKPEDVADLLWRRHAYNNAMLSMRRLFREEYEQQKGAGIGLDLAERELGVELDQLIAENERRNRDLAAQRAERERETLEKLEEETLREMERRLEKQTRSVREKTAEVERMIERSKDFITRENMHAKVQQALENPVTFDYAIDLGGQRVENPVPAKYFEGIKAQQKRIFDKTSGYALKSEGIVKLKREKKKPKEREENAARSAANKAGKSRDKPAGGGKSDGK